MKNDELERLWLNCLIKDCNLICLVSSYFQRRIPRDQAALQLCLFFLSKARLTVSSEADLLTAAMKFCSPSALQTSHSRLKNPLKSAELWGSSAACHLWVCCSCSPVTACHGTVKRVIGAFLQGTDRNNCFVSAGCCAPRCLLRTCCSWSPCSPDCKGLGAVPPQPVHGCVSLCRRAWQWLGSVGASSVVQGPAPRALLGFLKHQRPGRAMDRIISVLQLNPCHMDTGKVKIPPSKLQVQKYFAALCFRQNVKTHFPHSFP